MSSPHGDWLCTYPPVRSNLSIGGTIDIVCPEATVQPHCSANAYSTDTKDNIADAAKDAKKKCEELYSECQAEIDADQAVAKATCENVAPCKLKADPSDRPCSLSGCNYVAQQTVKTYNADSFNVGADGIPTGLKDGAKPSSESTTNPTAAPGWNCGYYGSRSYYNTCKATTTADSPNPAQGETA